MKYFLKLVLLLVFISCNNKHISNEYKKITYKSFSIEVPSNWNQIELKGIDSYVGGFLTAKNDTIIFDYGRNTSTNSEVIGVSDIKDKQKLDSLDFPIDEMFFSKQPKVDMNQGTFHNEYYYYENVDNRKVKLKVPKKIGTGITSIFFDSLTVKNDNLYLYGHNLDTLDQFKLLKAFKTIKIK